MKDNKGKVIGPIAVLLGMVLYNLLKGDNAIFILFIGLIIMYIYGLYEVNKNKKGTLEQNIVLTIAILLMIIGILSKCFSSNLIKYHLNPLIIPILIFSLIIMMMVTIVISVWKSGDKEKIKKLIIPSIMIVSGILLMFSVIII